MKKIWLTALAHDEGRVQKTMAMLKKYGLEVDGHFWVDDLEKMAWLAARDQLVDEATALWLILSSDKEIATDSVRYGLSLLALTVQAAKGHAFPVVLLHEGRIPERDALPTPLQGAEIYAADRPAIGAKLVARVHTPSKMVAGEYRLDLYAMPQIGQWFEVGPTRSPWKGVLFGTLGAEVNAHGVGPKGTLPEKCVLEYPMQGLKLAMGGDEYVAWAVQNELIADSSYYVRVQGEPGSILFGPLPEGDDADVFTLKLK